MKRKNNAYEPALHTLCDQIIPVSVFAGIFINYWIPCFLQYSETLCIYNNIATTIVIKFKQIFINLFVKNKGCTVS